MLLLNVVVLSCKESSKAKSTALCITMTLVAFEVVLLSSIKQSNNKDN